MAATASRPAPDSRSWARAAGAGAAFLVALGVRAAFFAAVPQPPASQLASYAQDSVHYLALAQRLLAGHGYSFWGNGPDAYVSPGYPLFVAAILHLFPSHPLQAIRWIQAVLGAATAAVVAGWAGFLAGVIVALYPSFIWSTGSILTEVLFLLLLVGYLALHARLLTSPRPSRGAAVAAGILLGLAVLTRPIAAALPVVIGLCGRWIRPAAARVRPSYGLGLVVATAALVNLPWWLRNVIVLHRLVLFATQASNPLVSGLSPQGASLQVPAGTNAYIFALQYVLHALRTDPGRFLQWMTVGKWSAVLTQTYAGGTPNGGFLQGLAHYQIALCWVGGAGLAWAAIFRPRLRVATVAAATLAILLLAFIPSVRYGYPLMALFAVGAGALIAGVFRGLLVLVRRLTGPRTAPP